jgi:hypothetical protein
MEPQCASGFYGEKNEAESSAPAILGVVAENLD